MQSPKPLDKNIQFLINANYQRMVTYEQAAFLTNEASFKQFYLDRADQSESNIQQLYLMLNIDNPEAVQYASAQNVNADIFLPNIFQNKKSTIKILSSIKMIEKTIGNWYKNTLKEIKDLPSEVVELVEAQYKLLNNSQLQLETL